MPMVEIPHNSFPQDRHQYPPLYHYYSFFFGQLVSILGSKIVSFSLIWWIAIQSDSAWYLSLASFLVFGVKVLISPIAGVFADRWDRKIIIFTTDLLQAVCSLLMIALFFFHHAFLWNVLLLMGISSGFAAFQDPTVNAIIPTMVPQKHLSNINSFIYFSTYVMQMLGPILGALLLSRWSIAQILWLDSISFVIAVFPLIFITIPKVSNNNEKTSSPLETLNHPNIPSSPENSNPIKISSMRKFWADFKEGLTIIKAAGILGLTLVFPFSNFLETPKNVLIPLLISDIYQGGPIIFASLMVAAQLTTAFTSLGLSLWKIPDTVPRQKIIVIGLIGIYLGSLLMIVPAQVLPAEKLGLNLIFLIIGVMMMGICSPIINITMMTIIQKLVPPEKLGRVEGVSGALSVSLIPIGTLLTGWIADLIGIRLIIFLSGIIAIAGMIIFYYTTDLSKLDEKLAKKACENTPTRESK